MPSASAARSRLHPIQRRGVSVMSRTAMHIRLRHFRVLECCPRQRQRIQHVTGHEYMSAGRDASLHTLSPTQHLQRPLRHASSRCEPRAVSSSRAVPCTCVHICLRVIEMSAHTCVSHLRSFDHYYLHALRSSMQFIVRTCNDPS